MSNELGTGKAGPIPMINDREREDREREAEIMAAVRVALEHERAPREREQRRANHSTSISIIALVVSVLIQAGSWVVGFSKVSATVENLKEMTVETRTAVTGLRDAVADLNASVRVLQDRDEREKRK